MSKKLRNFIPAILFLGILILGNACTTESPANKTNNSAANNANVNNVDEKSAKVACLDLEALKQKFPASVAKQVGSNFTMDYDPQYKVLSIRGAVYSPFDDLRGFIGALNDARNETCLRMITFEAKESGKEFRWCSSIDCSPKVPDLVKCSQNNIKALYKDVDIADQIAGNSLKPVFSEGNDGKLVLKGKISDKTKTNLTSFLEKIQKEVGDSACITTLSFTALPTGANTASASRQFEWQICEYPDCECLGSCVTTCPCSRTKGNENTNSKTE